MGVQIPCSGSPHVNLLLSQESTVEKGKQIFGLGFGLLPFSIRIWPRRRHRRRPAADPAASSRALFFPPAAFEVFDGEGFILQVHDVFTRIRSGATAVAPYGGALGSTTLSTAAVRTGGDFWLDLLGMVVNAWGEKP
jgi:hypothetical protein